MPPGRYLSAAGSVLWHLFTGEKDTQRSSQRLYRSLELAAHLGWTELLVDRYRDLVEIPAPTREGTGGGRYHFAPDDEGAFEYENYHNPDHTY
jgi:hypothetical protein